MRQAQKRGGGWKEFFFFDFYLWDVAPVTDDGSALIWDVIAAYLPVPSACCFSLFLFFFFPCWLAAKKRETDRNLSYYIAEKGRDTKCAGATGFYVYLFMQEPEGTKCQCRQLARSGLFCLHLEFPTSLYRLARDISFKRQTLKQTLTSYDITKKPDDNLTSLTISGRLYPKWLTMTMERHFERLRV